MLERIGKTLKRFRRLTESKKGLIVGGVLLLALITMLSFLYWQAREASLSKNQAVPPDICAQNATITFGCYKQQLEGTISKSGPQPAFTLLKSQFDQVPIIKSQCHQLVHIIGRAAFSKYKDLGDTFTNGDPFCWSGYYHGAMEELSQQKGNAAITRANSICAELRSNQFGSFNHYNCVHGLGHGFMFILEAKLFEALKACDNLTDSYESQSCYGGVFMQNIMNDQTPDRETDYVAPYLKGDDPMYPCTGVNDKYKSQCYLMQTSHALRLVAYDFQKVFALCDAAEAAYRHTCYQSLGRDASGNSVSDVRQTREKCLLGKDYNAQSNCIIGAVKDFVSYFHSDAQAKGLCASLTPELAAICSSTMKSYYAAF